MPALGRAARFLLALALLGAMSGCGGDEPTLAADPRAGAAVFASSGCGNCHALAAVQATGAVCPDLDETKPAYDLIVERVKNGGGSMPPFADALSEKEIQDVAAFVFRATRPR